MSETEPPPSPPPDTTPSPETVQERERRELGEAVKNAHEYTRWVILGEQHKTPRSFPAVKPPEDDEKGKPP